MSRTPRADGPAAPVRGTRVIRVPGLPNVRDTGGLPGPGGLRLGRRLLLRGPAPDTGTVAALSGLGVRTVVDLRRPAEGGDPDALALLDARVLRRPLHADLTGIRGVARPQPGAYLAHYRRLLPQAAPVAAEVLDLLAEPAAAPVYVCCSFGKDRTGLVCALVLRTLRVALADVAADYALTGRAYRALGPRDPRPAPVAAYPPADLAARTVSPARTMRRLLTDVEREHHDLRRYLELNGLRRSAWRGAMRRAYRCGADPLDAPGAPRKGR
ncbi:tyrosine-protein phosphatase [Kitasatospora sp. NBC_01266]|uniref:tyrosine-protein phosphatase n=1 Tax=Kitasatospora sp. NBC_01266 TaxID=2903572 RepID=UPI002E2F722F|nr:tyrosine-protein phosphatase [Kitasatospora sp. NBC_01266]